MARKAQRPDDIVRNVQASDIQSAGVHSRSGDDAAVELGAVLDTWYPRKAMVRLFEEKLVFLNGHKANPHTTVCEGDEIRIAMAKERVDYVPEPMNLAVLYEDEDLLILDKPAGLTVNSPGQVSLANGVAQYFKEHGIRRKVRFLNRLDRDTSGCIVIAKSGLAQSLYQQQMEDHTFEKWYRATVEGILTEDTGSLTYSMRKSRDGVHHEVHAEGKPTRTDFSVVRRYSSDTVDTDDTSGVTDVDVRLYTGKTHQIRVAFSYSGHPLVGDVLYGARPTGESFRLRAVKVVFTHMRSGERISVSC